MSLPVLLSALQSLDYTGPDSGTRTLLGVAGVLVVLAVVIGIGQMMTGSSKS